MERTPTFAEMDPTGLAAFERFPPTRYQGSKRKLATAILARLQGLEHTTVLDAFGGTGAMSYAFKLAGKSVTYNDSLTFNHQIGLALCENDTVLLDQSVVDKIGVRQEGVEYGSLIEATFEGIYFTDDENRWLDVAVGNIGCLAGRYQQAIAWFSLFQAAMAKRPYNLFHRANLYMRTADVERSFGNKVSWDRSFADHLRRFAAQANAAIIDSSGRCRAVCECVLDIEPGEFDLVYIDTPYINRAGVGVDYRHFYHFLEGMIHYRHWEEMIDHGSKHRRLALRDDPWSDRRSCHEMFRRLFERFRESILVVSYRSDGVPSISELVEMLRQVKGDVRVIDGDCYQYALSTNRRSREVLMIATD